MRNLTTLLLSVTTTAVLALPGTANSQGTTTTGTVKNASFRSSPPARLEPQNACEVGSDRPACFPKTCEVHAKIVFVKPSSVGLKDPEGPVSPPKCPTDTVQIEGPGVQCQLESLSLSEKPSWLGDFIINGFIESTTGLPYFEVFKPLATHVPGKTDLDLSVLDFLDRNAGPESEKNTEEKLVARAPLTQGEAGILISTPTTYVENWRKQLKIQVLCK